MGYDLQKKFLFLKIFFFLTVIIGCSDIFENAPPFPDYLLDIQEDPKYDFENEIIKDPNNSPGELQKNNISSLFELQQQYQQNCYKTEYFFCPPSLFLDEIWEFQLITDICKDPEEVIYKGPCEQKFECDPANTEPEIVYCSIVAETGGNIHGQQEKWCDKGIWKYTDCVACGPEICDGIDNDCNGEIDVSKNAKTNVVSVI